MIAVSAVGVVTMMPARGAVGAEAAPTEPPTAERRIEAERFRGEIENHLREIDEQLKTTLSEDLRRELAPKIVLAANELRTRS